MMMSSKRFSYDRSPSLSTTSGSEIFGSSKDLLVHELQAKILNEDLFQAIA